MANITIDTDVLKKNFLNVSEYLFLRNLYVPTNEKVEELFTVINAINVDHLEQKGFIKITELGYILRQKGLNLFQPEDLFDKFLLTFPIKTPKGRYLSSKALSGVTYDKVKNQFNRIFKNDKAAAERAIQVLEAEVVWRKKEGNLDYMKAIEAWLNDRTFEKIDYLLDENINAEDNAANYTDWVE